MTGLVSFDVSLILSAFFFFWTKASLHYSTAAGHQYIPISRYTSKVSPAQWLYVKLCSTGDQKSAYLTSAKPTSGFSFHKLFEPMGWYLQLV